jgi:hypothetical protein
MLGTSGKTGVAAVLLRSRSLATCMQQTCNAGKQMCARGFNGDMVCLLLCSIRDAKKRDPMPWLVIQTGYETGYNAHENGRNQKRPALTNITNW